MLSGIMQERAISRLTPDLTGLMTLLGRYFQIRDDYLNLISADVSSTLIVHVCSSNCLVTDSWLVEYSKQKSFCEDLDKGKYSLMLIHALQVLPEEENILLRNVLTRRTEGKLSHSHKQIVLELVWKSGRHFEHEAEIAVETKAISKTIGTQNLFQPLLDLLKV